MISFWIIKSSFMTILSILKTSCQVKFILSPKQRAKPVASRRRTCANAAVCIANGECPSLFRHRAENESVSGNAKTPPASHQVSAPSLKLMIQQIHSHVRVERDSGMCVARFLYALHIQGLLFQCAEFYI